MKVISLYIFIILFLQPLSAQKKLIFHKKDLSKTGFVVSSIDSMKFSNNDSIVNIYKKDNSIYSLPVLNIDSITIGTVVSPDYPVVKTNIATSVSYTSAVSGVYVKATGISTVKEKGICWSILGNPIIDNNKILSTSANDSSSVSITGLTANTVYYVRAYAINDAGISYGEQISFNTLSYSLPTSEVLTTDFNYSTNNVIVKAKINSNGGCDLTERGICWSTSVFPTINDSKYATGTSVGQFIALMTGLDISKTYYVRSYAVNCSGVGYGTPVKVVPVPGKVTYTLAVDSATYPQYYNLLKIALDSACWYYNRYTTFGGNIYVYYNSGIPTAQASYHGSIGFGPNTSYMHVATTMHEMAHFFGSGTTTSWKNYLVGGVWQGSVASALCLTLAGESLKGDNNANPIHFWPYGLNYRSEATSVSIYVNHCKIVNAMKTDCGWPNP